MYDHVIGKMLAPDNNILTRIALLATTATTMLLIILCCTPTRRGKRLQAGRSFKPPHKT